jgi:tetratricopeptide (TPR) repeat protein
VKVQLIGPDGHLITEVDDHIRARREEVVWYVTDAVGSYLLNVQTVRKDAPVGRYQISSVELRAAKEGEGDAIKLVKAFDSAMDLSTTVKFSRLKSDGDYDEAISIAKQELAAREGEFGPSHPKVASVLIELADVYLEIGNYAQAELLLERAIAIDKGAGLPLRSLSEGYLNSLADIYQFKGDYAKAAAMYQRLLARPIRSVSPLNIPLLRELANLYRDQGNYAKAELLYQRALANAKTQAAPDLFSSEILNDLATLYLAKGNYVKAEPVLRRALKSELRVSLLIGSDFAALIDDPHVASLFSTRSNAKDTAARTGNPLNAEQAAEAAASVNEVLDRPEIAAIFSNFAILYSLKGDYVKAGAISKRVRLF